MIIKIDDNSGFCFGVVNAIDKAETFLKENKKLYCLGDIVHNSREVDRLKAKGLETINREQYQKLKNVTVLIRAHGEPPETYKIALQNNLTLIDATCPVVLKLQKKIKLKYLENKDRQIVIYGKPNHAEVNGLVGQTSGTAVVINDEQDLDKIDFTRPVSLFSQTTRGKEGFEKIRKTIEQSIETKNPGQNNLLALDTTCLLVSRRKEALANFAGIHDLILFVSGKKSSNGKMLFDLVSKYNKNSFFVSHENKIKKEWFGHAKSVGICGATSTPRWLMEEIAAIVRIYAG